MSYKIKSELEIFSINRKEFPILILNPNKVKKLKRFTENPLGTDVHFNYKTCKIIVNLEFYEKVKLVIESYFNFTESPTFEELLSLKLPSDEILDLINVEKTVLLKKISGLGSDDKKRIESIVDDVLANKNVEDVGILNNISRILYFIDISFIKMIAPEFIEEILAY